MISLHQVNKTYETPAGKFAALKDVDLEIEPGQFVGIVGKSGSGKSTLLNLVAGIDRPSAGSVAVAGTEIQSLSENKLAAWRGRNVGFVFQFFQLLPTLTAAENVMLPMDFSKSVPLRERRKRAVALLERVGVGAHADKLPATLSGGEQQRVAIARALANEPPLVLADEPTGNLDSVTATEILDLFRSMANQGTTVVIATHEADIARVIDRRIEISDGEIHPQITQMFK
ncbi:MAG TPA: ABC transporter ATP-binding protein [Pyrinomonadaceae bacterium]|jgi:putative ABC transport system ATP-binding protein|nr:ABC transporter ATP-binding protein [Pyrinomonadaceae bacterium]